MQVKLNVKGQALIGKELLDVEATSIDRIGVKFYHYEDAYEGEPCVVKVSEVLVEEEILT